MKITITYSNKSLHTLLGISVNHQLCDAHSFFQMLNSWSALAKESRPAISEVDMSTEIKPNSFNIASSPKEPKEAGYVYKPIWSKISSFATTMKKYGKCKFTTLNFSSSDIQMLKDKIGAVGNTSQAVSTNDVLCCHMWKVLARFRTEIQEEQKFPLQFVANFRNFSGVSVKPEYFGNATIFGVIDSLTRKQVENSSLATLALTSQKLVDTIRLDPTFLETRLQYLHYAQYNSEAKIESFYYLANPIDFGGLFVSNWVNNDVYGKTQKVSETDIRSGIDLGQGKPSKLIFPSIALPYLAIMLPSASGGVDWVMSAPEENLTKILDFHKTVGLADLK